MAHCMVSGLLRETVFVLLHKFLNDDKPCLLFLESGLELVCLCELVRHFILHFLNLLAVLLHFFVDTSLQILDLFQISLSSLNLDL